MNLAPIVKREGPITEGDIFRLAREIARNLKPLELVLEQKAIDSGQWGGIKTTPLFHVRLAEEAAVWPATTKDTLRNRIATKAAVAVEELLVQAIGMVADHRLGGEARVKALQFLAKIGQLDGQNMTKDDGSGRVTINILLGGEARVKALQFLAKI